MDIKTWLNKKPLLKEVMATNEVYWQNANELPYLKAIEEIELTMDDVIDADLRLKRFAPYIKKVFPETKENHGIIESPLKRIPLMKKSLMDRYKCFIEGELLLKCDNELPISGSIKARGGIYEVLKHAENLAIHHKMLDVEDDYSILDSKVFRAFFHQYKIAVGSTGNLGLSIGIMSAKLGFQVFVHMSQDAKEWKKEMLRRIGVSVIEYASDYSEAVKQGRLQALNDPYMYFIDDENSTDLFLGYAVSALRLKGQLESMDIKVNDTNPLYVYLPCGVGGGPGGVTFGLKLIFKDAVKCIFAEPTHSPCMLIGLVTGLHDRVSVQDFGIDNKTIADGLAVGRPSGFVGKTLNHLISGVYTVTDETLLTLLRDMMDMEEIPLEPSALAGLYGPVIVGEKTKGTHLAWATGGGMVPFEIINDYYHEKIVKL